MVVVCARACSRRGGRRLVAAGVSFRGHLTTLFLSVPTGQFVFLKCGHFLAQHSDHLLRAAGQKYGRLYPIVLRRKRSSSGILTNT